MDDQTKYKIAGAVLKDNDDGSIRFRLITDVLDRDSEVMLPSGAELANWKKNGVWLWAHNREAWGGIIRPPIGKINPNTIDQTEKYLENDVFFDEKNDEFAKMIANKHRDGFLKAVSVGFDPIKVNLKPIRDGQKGVTHEEYEIFEGSSVPVPANPEALQQNEWGDFMEKCKKYGIKNTGMKAWLKMAGWKDEDIKDALQSEQTRINIPYETSTVTTSENFKITDISEGKKAEIEKSDDSETPTEIENIINPIDSMAMVEKLKSDEGLSFEEAASAIYTALGDMLEPPKEKDNTQQLIIDELNSINVFNEPDASTMILANLKEIDTSLKS